MNLPPTEAGQVKLKKNLNLARIINLMNDGQGPDLLGICEVENQRITQNYLKK